MDVNPQTEPSATSSASSASASVSNGVGAAAQEVEKKDSLLGFAWFVTKLVIAVLILRSFVFSPFSIPSESMLPRLWQGDYVIATKWSYGYSRHSLPFSLPIPTGRIFASEPERGDIVIFKHPIDEQDYVKRVIGLPGDTVSMIGGQVVLNGKMISKDAAADFEIPLLENTVCVKGGQERGDRPDDKVCAYKRFNETLPSGVTYEVLDLGLSIGDAVPITTVPEGHLFVMGDHRDYSQDSRFPAAAGGAVGLVPQDNLVGRARFIFWSTDGSAQWIEPWTWFSATRWDRIGTGL
ncbi:MAG: signal peptidase I [Pseudomonadota bacterium]